MGVEGGLKIGLPIDHMLPYRRFLGRLHEDLVEAIRVAENEGWHHLPIDSENFICYNRILTQIASLEERMVHYVYVKTGRVQRPLIPRQIREATNTVVGYPDGGYFDRGRPEPGELTVGSDQDGHDRDDSGEDPD